MRFLKISAIFLGAAAVLIGSDSCKKDDNNGIECCSFSYTDNGTTYKIRACEDGKVTITYDGETETYDWHDDYSNWSEVKSYILDEGGHCN